MPNNLTNKKSGLEVSDPDQLISARSLHYSLNIQTDFTRWFRNIKTYSFIEGYDYARTIIEGENGFRQIDYLLAPACARVIRRIDFYRRGRKIQPRFLDLSEENAVFLKVYINKLEPLIEPIFEHNRENMTIVL